MKRTHQLVATALVLVTALVVPATVGASAKSSEPTARAARVTLIGSGSTAMQPFLVALFKGYKKYKPNIKFIYTADGGNAGVKDVQAGRSDFAGNARPPVATDKGTTYYQAFLDGLCIDVNPANKLTDISMRQAADIFRGTVTNWGDIPGSGLTTTIAPFGRDTNGGTYNFVHDGLLGGHNPGSDVTPLLSDGLVANAVKRNPNGIGYNGLGWFNPLTGVKGIKKLRLNNIPCSAKYVKAQTYPLTRFLFLVLPTASPNPNVLKFVDWVRTSTAAGLIIKKVGGVPAFNKKVS
jgi:phosphate transport system substrate-binding protein